MKYVDHMRYRRFVDAFVDGELDDDRHRRVADHIGRCPRCERSAVLTASLKHSLARVTPARRTLDLVQARGRRVI